jgi:nitroreductase
MHQPLFDQRRPQLVGKVGDAGEVERRRGHVGIRQEPVPTDYLEAILRLAAQAPAESQSHPWRFIVVREVDARERLQWADAPVVLITFTLQPMKIEQAFRNGASTTDSGNRQGGIALATIMLLAEAYGLGTEPMVGFDAEAVKGAFGIPSDAEVVALLAMGFAEESLGQNAASQMVLGEIVHVERYGQPWMG